MISLRQFSIALGSFAAAISIGFVMQNGSASAGRVSIATGGVFTPTASDFTPAMPARPVGDAAGPVVLASLHSTGAAPQPRLGMPEGHAARPALPSCDVTLEARPEPGALVALDISAPCHGNQRATLHHKGMMVSLATDASGQARITAPALAQQASFILAFDDAAGAIAQLDVPEFAEVQRAVVQWQGGEDFQIHAFEFGAEFNAPGHIWQQNPGQSGQEGQGFLMTLGDATQENPLLAQVYTFPAATPQGEIRLEVEAKITEANCGQEIAAQSLQFRPGAAMEAVDLMMTMPNCDAVSDFLILQNMLRDMKTVTG